MWPSLNSLNDAFPRLISRRKHIQSDRLRRPIRTLIKPYCSRRVSKHLWISPILDPGRFDTSLVDKPCRKAQFHTPTAWLPAGYDTGMQFPRLRRFERAASPAPMELTARDRNIIQLVHRQRFLRSSHFAALMADTSQQLLRRLQLLFHHGFL